MSSPSQERQRPEAGQPRQTNIYDVGANDPDGRLVQRGHLSEADLRGIGELMAAMGALRESEDKLSEASLAYMKLGRTDMRALHFLIVTANKGEIATPGAIATHLRISTASTTKLLDRLERGGHVTRAIHPADRRAFAIEITSETREAAMNTVGRQHAKRFEAAARLSDGERAIVTRFLLDTAAELDVSGEAWAQGGAS